MAEVLGHHSHIEEIISKTVNQRYEQFAKIFKKNLENVETAMIERMDTYEVIDLSNKIKDKKDVISKIIEETNMNSSLTKQDLEAAIKENNSNFKDVKPDPVILKNKLTRTTPDQNLDRVENLFEQTVEKPEKFEFIEKNQTIEKPEPIQKIQKNPDKQSAQKCSLTLPEPNHSEFVSEYQENRMKTISITEIQNIEATILSPIFPETITFPELNSPIFVESARYPVDRNSTSPIPARPSAPLMFLDMDDCNISLESLLNSSTPNNKKSMPGLPLLNLRNLPIASAPPITSDPRINTSAEFVRKFAEEVFQSMNLHVLENAVNAGIQRNPLETLEQIHELDLGNFVEKGEFPSIINVFQITETLFEDITANDVQTTQRVINKADKIHKIMIISVIDELLQKHRPYGIKGIPMP